MQKKIVFNKDKEMQGYLKCKVHPTLILCQDRHCKQEDGQEQTFWDILGCPLDRPSLHRRDYQQRRHLHPSARIHQTRPGHHSLSLQSTKLLLLLQDRSTVQFDHKLQLQRVLKFQEDLLYHRV